MTTARKGFTLVEVLAVMALLVVLGAILAPTLRLFGRDSGIQAAGDVLRARIAEARGEAMEHGLAYRLAVSQDGTRVRAAPDDQNFDKAAVTNDDAKPLVVEDQFPKGVTARSEPPDGSAPAVDADGWTRVATFQPDGTCREDAVAIRLTYAATYPLVVRVRGLTGAVTITAEKKRAGR